jgi:hypothetical protein
LGADLSTIAGRLQEAVSAAVLSPQQLEALLSFLITPATSAPAEFEAQLRRLVSSSAKSMEARLAHAAESGDATAIKELLVEDLRAQLGRLRDDPALVSFLRGQGKLKSFQQAVDRVMERLTAGNLNNARNDYLFMELPFSPGGPITHAHLHFIGDGGAAKERPGGNSMAVLDVSTSRLGDLWITLQKSGQYARCRFLATSEAAIKAIDDASGALAEALRKTGTPNVTVSAGVWNGDRLAQTARLMGSFGQYDVTV